MRRQRAIGGHHSARSITNEWLTPPYVLDALGGAESFDLDPCAPVERPWPTARMHYSVLDNGLRLPWNGRVWMNPPYTRPAISDFLNRLADHGRGVALIFARTETDLFFRHVWDRASALLFIRGRLHFHFPDGLRAPANSGAPSVLCAYGIDDADVLASCEIDGQFVPLRLPRFAVVVALEQTWADAVADHLRKQSGPVRLDDLYRDLSRHHKTRSNRHYREKIRQTLQRGPFRRVARGEWEMAV